MSTVAAGPRPGAVGDRAAEGGRSARYWLKAATFILGVLVWALLMRAFLGAGPGDTGAPGPSPRV
jgi:hypothetical protein